MKIRILLILFAAFCVMPRTQAATAETAKFGYFDLKAEQGAMGNVLFQCRQSLVQATNYMNLGVEDQLEITLNLVVEKTAAVRLIAKGHPQKCAYTKKVNVFTTRFASMSKLTNSFFQNVFPLMHALNGDTFSFVNGELTEKYPELAERALARIRALNEIVGATESPSELITDPNKINLKETAGEAAAAAADAAAASASGTASGAGLTGTGGVSGPGGRNMRTGTGAQEGTGVAGSGGTGRGTGAAGTTQAGTGGTGTGAGTGATGGRNPAGAGGASTAGTGTGATTTGAGNATGAGGTGTSAAGTRAGAGNQGAMREPGQIDAQQVLRNYPEGGIKGRNLSIPTVSSRGILIKESIYELKWNGRDYERGALKGEIEWQLGVQRLGPGKYKLTDRNGSKFTVKQWVVEPPNGGQKVTHPTEVLENAFVEGVRGDYRITAYGVTDHQVNFSYTITVSQRR